MTPTLAKSLASLIVAIMTFLGWNISDYEYLLPPTIKNEIVSSSLEQNSSSEATSTKVTDQNISIEKNTIQTPVVQSDKTIQTKISKQKKSQPLLPSKPESPVQTNPQPVYYPAPVQNQNPIKTEIQNIVNQIIPPETPTEVAKEKVTLSTEDKIKNSLVNIYCSRIIGNKIQKVTGSGVVIDPNGVVITNAHVAEYFLLAENGNGTDCFIRTGSPAVSSYKAKLIYLPTAWVNANRNNLSLSTLTGTGENDYALLVITGRVRSDAPNIPLTFLATQDSYPTQNENIFVAGYPAGFSDVRLLDSALYELTKPTSITRVSSFTGSTADVINTGPTTVAEHGSSGGGVIDMSGNLVALIAATTIDSTTGQKNIQAISLPYIKQSVKNYTGKTFEALISNPRDEADNFAKTSLPILANTLLGN